MKHIYILLCLISSVTFAQIPSNYYDSAEGLTGFDLKSQLSTIITNGHVDQGYAALYTAYQDTHTDNIAEAGYENDGTILLYYTENLSGTDPYTYTHGNNNCGNFSQESDCYNREHIVPQSAFDSANPMRTDVHHVIPSDGFVNGQRGSLPFGDVATASWTSLNGSKRGTSDVPGYSGNVFEPLDEFKGDIARAILYFVTRYENNVDNYDSFPMFNGTENQALEDWAVDLLLDWHYNVDPVDQRERDRNDASYNFQGNANPFVDHPEYVNLIWNPTQDEEAPTNPTNLVASSPTDSSIALNWTASTDNIEVTSYDIYVDGVNTFNSATTSFTVTGLLADTNYCFTVKAKDAANNQSGFSNESCETTTNNGSGANCAEETFESIPSNSGSYADRTWTGDNGFTWNATDARTDQTINGRAITVRAGEMNSASVSGGIGSFTVTTQRKFSGGSGTFTLRVNGTDVGTIPFDDSVQTTTINDINIEGDVVILITANSNNDRVAFDDLSWTCYSELGLENFDKNSTSIYPNPLNGSILNIKSNAAVQVTIYDVLGKQVATSNKKQIDLSHLSKGLFLIRLESENGVTTKKLIKN